MSASMRCRVSCALVLFATTPVMAQSSGASGAGEGEGVNNGQDFTRPVRRVDVRYQYQQVDDDLHSNIFTARMDWPIPLSERWKLSTRIDLPFIDGNVPSLDNLDGNDEFGSGDMLLQALFIHPIDKELAIGVGSQAILPTASQDQFGSGKYRLLPTALVRYAPASLPDGWFLAGVVRYDFDVGGDDDREHVSDLVVIPVLNMNFPGRWFVTLAPECKYSFLDDAWFVPFDATIGRMVSATTIMSLEIKHEVLDDRPQYDWAAEFRVGFFF